MGPAHATPRAPTDATSFVGRETDLARIDSLFASGARLVTVLGPAGTGKTRLSRRYAGQAVAAGSAPGGAWFCDLAEARSRRALVAQVAAVLGVTASDGDSTAPIGHSLADRGAALLVLDNFEQLVAHGPDTVAAWLSRARDVRVLVTSRERLGLEGEMCLQLEGLPEDVALRLYVERARSARADFMLSDESRVDALSLVRSLEGMPLAIELAAARVAVLPPRKLLERIGARLDLLKSPRRDVTGRQATLRGAIDVSWELLNDDERLALAACSVFRGGFSLEAAETVLAGAETVDLILALVDKSLLRRYELAPGVGDVRFGLYESVRDYASEKLELMGLAGQLADRHAAWVCEEGERWARELLGPDTVQALLSLRLESENLLAAHRRFLRTRPDVSTRAALALSAALAVGGPFDQELELLDAAAEAARRLPQGVVAATSAGSDERELLGEVLLARGYARRAQGKIADATADFEEALTLARGRGKASLEADALDAAGRHALESGKSEAAREMLNQALAIRARLGDALGEGKTLRAYGALELKQNRIDDARLRSEQALAKFREAGCRSLECSVQCSLGIIHQWQGREAEARQAYERALELALAIGDRREECIIRTNLGIHLADEGRADEARAELARALELQRLAGHRQFVGNVIGSLGGLEHDQQRVTEARACFTEALHIFRELGNRRYECVALRYLGLLAFEEGRGAEAVTLLEQAAQIARDVGDLGGFVLGPLAAALAMNGDAQAAAAVAEEARSSVRVRGEPRAVACVDLFEGIVDLGSAQAAGRSGDAQGREQLVARARGRLRGPSSDLVRRSADGRVVLRLLEKALEAADATSRLAEPATVAASGGSPSDARALVVGPELRWFRAPGGEQVDLSTRRPIRLILTRLVLEHHERPGVGASLEQLVAAGWPGQRIQTEAAASRVYTSIKTLRELGLARQLLRRDDGYLLDPELVIEHLER